MQRFLCFLIAMVLLVGAPAGLLAADGKAVFTNKCAKCHGAGGKAEDIKPVKFASMQWQRFIDGNRHARKLDISSQFNAAELSAVKSYLMQHAADSDKPEASGLR